MRRSDSRGVGQGLLEVVQGHISLTGTRGNNRKRGLRQVRDGFWCHIWQQLRKVKANVVHGRRDNENAIRLMLRYMP